MFKDFISICSQQKRMVQKPFLVDLATPIPSYPVLTDNFY